MDPTGMSRREAGRRLMLLAAAASCVPLGAQDALAALQPRIPKKDKDKDKNNKPPAQNPGGGMPNLDTLIVRGRSHDWTLKIWVVVQAFQHSSKDALILESFDLATAAVVFPINKGCASAELKADEVSGVLKLNDQIVDDRPKYSDASTPPKLYQAGTRLARWEIENRKGRQIELELELPMTCFETRFDEMAAMQVPWPNTWPPSAASTLADDKIADPNDPAVQKLVKDWTDGGNTKSIPPVQLAKYLMGQVLEYCQSNGDGLRFGDSGLFRGVDLQPVGKTASTGRGSEHDVVTLLTAVYRAAGLPARTVIGYDVSEKKGEDSGFLGRQRKAAQFRAWVEFCLYDEAKRKEAWIPVDVIRQRRSGTRAPSLDARWKYFGNNDDTDDVMPFAFQYHPPTTVVAHGYPAFWGWFTTPELQIAEQTLRFDAQTTARRTNLPSPREVKRPGPTQPAGQPGGQPGGPRP